MSKEYVIGIDLGTTNSCVSFVDQDQTVVIANQQGYKTTPSMVAFDDENRRLVGFHAKRQAVTNPARTVYAFKRLIGRKWNAPEVEKMKMVTPFEMVEGAHDDVRILVDKKQMSIPEISAMVLLELKRVAEEHLQTSIKKVVVTVPAYFNDNQRQATKDAGRIAGLEVIRIINEPTAACLAYGFRKNMKKKLAVFDLGGGTFDISIMELADGVFEVISTAGDTFLGGEDFDRLLMEEMMKHFHTVEGIDLSSDRMALQRIKDAAEAAKVDLTASEQTQISLPFIHAGNDGPKHFNMDLTRKQFESMVESHLNHAMEICQKALAYASLNPQDIDDVVLVGGSTRIPLVQKMIKDLFGKEPSKSIHPDEAVASGAAIQGHILSNDKVEDMVLLDVTPLSLGIATAGGTFTKLIEKNTTVPTDKHHVFTTTQDNQTAVKIQVLQGEAKLAADSILLGEFVLAEIPPAPRGQAEIDVNFSIDADGIVNASARDKHTGREQSITVTASSGLTNDEIDEMAKDTESYEITLKNQSRLEEVKSRIGSVLVEMERLFSAAKKPLGEDVANKTRKLMDSAKNKLDTFDIDTAQNYLIELEKSYQLMKGASR